MCVKLEPKMSDVSIVVGQMVDREAMRSRVKRSMAQEIVARRIGTTSRTLSNIRSGRIKHLREWIAVRVRQAFIAELESEIARLPHELELVSQSGARPDADEMLAAQSLLSQARALIEGK